MRALLLGLLAGTLAIPLHVPAQQLTDEGAMPALTGATTWLNSKPLTAKQLRGKVVLVDFWTYSCVNCLRALPYVKAWDAKYRDQGLVVIGVHTPEFDFEHKAENVKKSLAKLGITYPVAMDNNLKIWDAFHNQYWPAHYFIDKQGRIRFHHFGEGNYDESERVIRALLAENRAASLQLGNDTAAMVSGIGTLTAADMKNIRSPETYVGYGRAQRMVSQPVVQRDVIATYATPKSLAANAWALNGAWQVFRQYGTTASSGASITYRFHARDLNLVLGTVNPGTSIKFRVTVDGRAPGADAGADIDATGNGVITDHRLYQLVRQRGPVKDRTFTITFEGTGAQAYAFTFG